MDSDRLQTEVVFPVSMRPKRRRNEAASSCSLSFGYEVQSPVVASSSSIEDEAFGGLWSMGTVEKESEGRRSEKESGIVDRWCFGPAVRCEGMGFGVAKKLRWAGGQDRVSGREATSKNTHFSGVFLTENKKRMKNSNKICTGCLASAGNDGDQKVLECCSPFA
ncbi:unnamed protein product [Lactuca saligna]|uniref:Uncharacterized protein n=1 Tax=Lactuca saligna TaxID=75948 RepID=A0AA36EAD4_LACSI|nr:unnamed protein product [Lactuca saligna]